MANIGDTVYVVYDDNLVSIGTLVRQNGEKVTLRSPIGGKMEVIATQIKTYDEVEADYTYLIQSFKETFPENKELVNDILKLSDGLSGIKTVLKLLKFFENLELLLQK